MTATIAARQPQRCCLSGHSRLGRGCLAHWTRVYPSPHVWGEARAGGMSGAKTEDPLVLQQPSLHPQHHHRHSSRRHVPQIPFPPPLSSVRFLGLSHPSAPPPFLHLHQLRIFHSADWRRVGVDFLVAVAAAVCPVDRLLLSSIKHIFIFSQPLLGRATGMFFDFFVIFV